MEKESRFSFAFIAPLRDELCNYTITLDDRLLFCIYLLGLLYKDTSMGVDDLNSLICFTRSVYGSTSCLSAWFVLFTEHGLCFQTHSQYNWEGSEAQWGCPSRTGGNQYLSEITKVSRAVKGLCRESWREKKTKQNTDSSCALATQKTQKSQNLWVYAVQASLAEPWTNTNRSK